MSNWWDAIPDKNSQSENWWDQVPTKRTLPGNLEDLSQFGSLTGGLDDSDPSDKSKGFWDSLYQANTPILGSMEELVAQAKKAQIPSMNLGKMLEGKTLLKTALATTGLAPIVALSQYGSELNNETSPEKINQEAENVLQKHFDERVGNSESDLRMRFEGAIPQAIGAMADPVNAALMMAQAGPAEAIGKAVIGKAGTEIGETLASKFTNPIARAMARNAGEVLPNLTGNTAMALPVGAVQTALGNPDADASEILKGAAKNALMNIPMELASTSYFAARGASPKGPNSLDFENASKLINEHDSVLNDNAPDVSKLPIEDINFRENPSSNIDLLNRRTGDVVGSAVQSSKGPIIGLTTQIDPSVHASIEKALLNRLQKQSEIPETSVPNADLQSLDKLIEGFDVNRQPEVRGSGDTEYKVQRWETLKGSNPLRGGVYYRIQDDNANAPTSQTHYGNLSNNESISVSNLSYRNTKPTPFTNPGMEGGSYSNERTFAPSNPLVLNDKKDAFGSISGDFMKSQGLQPEEIKTLYNSQKPSDHIAILVKYGIDPKEASEIVNYSVKTGDPFLEMNSLLAHLAKQAGHDAIIKPDYLEYIDLTEPHVMGAFRVQGPPGGGSGTQAFLEHGVGANEHVSLSDPEFASKITQIPSIPAEAVGVVSNATKAITDGLGGGNRFGALKSLLEANQATPEAVAEAYGQSPPAPTEDVVNQAVDVAARAGAPIPDGSSPRTETSGTTFPTAVSPTYGKEVLGTPSAFTMALGSVKKLVNVVRKNWSWENQLRSADIASMASKYEKGSVQQKALQALPLMDAQLRDQIGTELGKIHGSSVALSSALQDATERAVAQRSATGQMVDPAQVKADIQSQMFNARKQGTPTLIQDPELQQIHTDLWRQADIASQAVIEAVPKSLRPVFQDLMGSYMERKYAVDIDPKFGLKIKSLKPELVEPAVAYIKDKYGITDEAEIEGMISHILADKTAIPNRAGQAQIVTGVGKDLEYRRNLSDEGKQFWDRIQTKEADLAKDPNSYYNFSDEFDRYLGNLRKAGKEKLADETYSLFLEQKKSNPKISDRNAVRLAWEDQSFPPVLRALAGEITDPVAVYQLTTAHLAERALTWRFMKEQAQRFSDAGMLSDKPVGGLNVALSDPDFYQALGMDIEKQTIYTTPDVKMIFDGLNDPTVSHPIIQAAVSAAKFSKVMSARGLSRQVVQAPTMILANGHMSWAIKNPAQFSKEVMPESVKAAAYFLTGKKEFLTPTIEAGQRLGVLKAGAFAGEMIHFSDELKKLSPQSIEAKISGVLKSGLNGAGKAYGMADAFAMFTGWQIEARQLAWARDTGITPEILKEASSTVKDTYQNSSRVPPWAAKLSSNPFSAGFVSFTAEMYRNQKNMAIKNAHYGMEAKRAFQSALDYSKQGDLLNSDRQMKVAQRFTQLAAEGMTQQVTALAAGAAVAGSLKAQVGIDDKKETAFRHTMAYPGQENSTYLFTDFKKGKSMEAIDTSSADSYDPVSRWYNVLSSTPGGIPDKALGIAKEASNQFLTGPFGLGLIGKAMVESLSDKRLTSSGLKDIPADQRANLNPGKVLANFGDKAFKPSQVKDVERAYKAVTGEKKSPKSTEPQYTLAGEALHSVGWERSNFDFFSRIADRSGEFAGAWSSLKAKLDKQSSFKIAINPKLQKELVDQYKSDWESAYTDMRNHVQNARELGMTAPEIKRALQLNRVGSAVLFESLWNGTKLPLSRYLNSTGYWDKQTAK